MTGRDAAATVIALTGGTGFVGHNLAAHLLGAGFRVRALVRGDRVPEALAAAELVRGDLEDEAALEVLVRGAGAVVHVAGAVRAAHDRDFYTVNAEGTRRIATAWASHADDARFMLVSSLAAREPDLSAYAASKREAERALAAAAPNRDARWTVLRPTAVYGPGDIATLALFKMMSGRLPVVPNGPSARVTLLHVADLAEAISAVIRNGPTRSTLEVTDARAHGYTWGELVELIGRTDRLTAASIRLPGSLLLGLGAGGDLAGRLTGRPPPISSGKVRELLHVDWSSSLANQLDAQIWSPRISAREGLEETVKWYRDTGWMRK